jgi:HD superfamily phosphodiesterase
MGDISENQRQKINIDTERTMKNFLLEYFRFARSLNRWAHIREVNDVTKK